MSPLRLGDILKIEKIKITSVKLDELIARSLASDFFGISFNSIYIQNYFIELLCSKDTRVTTVNSSKIDEQWIESNSVQQDLFGEEKVFLINESSKLSNAVLDRLLNEVDKKLIFCDSGKMDKVLSRVGGVDLLMPKFWEFRGFASFLCKLHGLSLEARELDLIEVQVEKSTDSYWKLFLLLAQFKDTHNNEVYSEIINESKSFDQFRFIDLLNLRRKKELLRSLIEVKNFQELESLCSSLISHGLKILDPSGIKQKVKLNKFDQSIVKASDIWKENELMSFLGILKRVSYFCRSKNKEAFIELMKASF